ncbi:MAG: hypothetical protein HY788_08680 [Deltaproteobacteria bacterium]|nr:hypothetical protein [Deltaproteobacteria bacterium]
MKRRVLLVAFLCVFLVPGLVYANSAPGWFPDWADDYNTLWAYWHWNGAATPYMSPTDWGTNPGPLNQPLLTTDYQGHDLAILANNYDHMNPYKEGWVKFGSTYNVAYDVSVSTPGGFEVTNLEVTDQYEVWIGGYKYYFTEWSFKIEPNPCWENVYFDFNVTGDDLVGVNCPLPLKTYAAIATQCVVPIPGAVWLFGAGLLGLVGFRKKIKK